MPVPLHKARYFSRQYNQSADLARHLGAGNRHTVHFKPNILLRNRNTRTMGGLLRKKRLQNVSGAFRQKDDNLDVTMGKSLLLVDDVVTTGATMESYASLLMSHGKAASVSALILLRVM